MWISRDAPLTSLRGEPIHVEDVSQWNLLSGKVNSQLIQPEDETTTQMILIREIKRTDICLQKAGVGYDDEQPGLHIAGDYSYEKTAKTKRTREIRLQHLNKSDPSMLFQFLFFNVLC